jgi:hypothetical protein
MIDESLVTIRIGMMVVNAPRRVAEISAFMMKHQTSC